MKLATLKDGSPDGELYIVSRDLKRSVAATGIAPMLQAAIDADGRSIFGAIDQTYVQADIS